ncbi:MAG: hypothetical protein ACRDDZ_03750 [Marinifilaceae bacterium]
MHTKKKIEEMAKLLALSPDTVVKALINESGVSHKTREMVLRMAKEMGIQTIHIEKHVIEEGYFSIGDGRTD